MENMTENPKKNISVFAKFGARYRFACGAAPAWLRSERGMLDRGESWRGR